MSVQILVPFNSRLRVEDIISLIEEAAKPGSRFPRSLSRRSLGMVPGSLVDNRIFEGRHASGKENHGEILAGGAKGVGRRDGCSMSSRFAKGGSKGERDCLYRQFVKRGGNLSSWRRDLSRNAGAE
jgi:hypothetical protein